MLLHILQEKCSIMVIRILILQTVELSVMTHISWMWMAKIVSKRKEKEKVGQMGMIWKANYRVFSEIHKHRLMIKQYLMLLVVCWLFPHSKYLRSSFCPFGSSLMISNITPTINIVTLSLWIGSSKRHKLFREPNSTLSSFERMIFSTPNQPTQTKTIREWKNIWK